MNTYSSGRLYDLLSCEKAVYRKGRAIGIDALGLREGQQVLDVGCGTGFNFDLVHKYLGESGSIVGMDLNPAMLDSARKKASSAGWHNIELHEIDASQMTAATVGVRSSGADAIIFTYTLSVITHWREALDAAISMLRPSGSILIVDMAAPTGVWRVLSPFAHMACRVGGADIDRHPWTALAGRAEISEHRMTRGGHIHVVTARVKHG